MAVSMCAHHGVEWQALSHSRQPLEVDHPQRLHRLGVGEPLAYSPGTPYTAAWTEMDGVIVGLDMTSVEDQAAAALAPGQELSFAFDVAVSPAAAEHWRRTVGLVRRVGLANVDNSDGALLAHELNLLLGSAALVCFANSTLRDSPAAAAERPTPESMRRAIAFIESTLDRPVTLSEIAMAARVGPRALHVTFRRHLHDPDGVRPTSSPRLCARRPAVRSAWGRSDGHQHRELLGLVQLPRFGVLYRKTYGRQPSQTLRSSRAS